MIERERTIVVWGDRKKVGSWGRPEAAGHGHDPRPLWLLYVYLDPPVPCVVCRRLNCCSSQLSHTTRTGTKEPFTIYASATRDWWLDHATQPKSPTDTSIVAIMTNRKLHTCFWLAVRLNCYISPNFLGISHDFATNKYKSILSATEL